MRRIFVAALVLAFAICPAIAADQVQGTAAPAAAPATQAAMANNKAVVEHGVSSATITVPASSEPQQFQVDLKPLIDGLLPYIVSALGLVITALGGAITVWLKTKWNIDIDSQHRDAWQQATLNAAGALLARGAVAIGDDGKVTVKSAEMAHVINTVSSRVPEAIKHFGFTPEDMEHLIMAKVPQVMSGIAVPVAASGQAAQGAG